MIRIAAAALLLVSTSSAPPVVGGAAHYAPNLMERVSRNRGLPVVRCMVAVTNDFRIGVWVTVERPATGHRERCRITDICDASKGHCRALARRNVVAELSWEAAKRVCGIRRVNQEPPRACRVRVWR